jgi:hypothetical protein
VGKTFATVIATYIKTYAEKTNCSSHAASTMLLLRMEVIAKSASLPNFEFCFPDLRVRNVFVNSTWYHLLSAPGSRENNLGHVVDRPTDVNFATCHALRECFVRFYLTPVWQGTDTSSRTVPRPFAFAWPEEDPPRG